MKLRPLNDNVILLRDVADKRTPGGLILPDSDQKPRRGVVLAVGPGGRPNYPGQAVLTTDGRLPMSLKVGDRVLYAMFAGVEEEDAGQTYVSIAEDKVLAVIEREE